MDYLIAALLFGLLVCGLIGLSRFRAAVTALEWRHAQAHAELKAIGETLTKLLAVEEHEQAHRERVKATLAGLDNVSGRDLLRQRIAQRVAQGILATPKK